MLECRVVERKPIGRGAIYLVENVETHVNEGILVDPRKWLGLAGFDPVVFGPNGNYYRPGERLGKAYEMGAALRGKPESGAI